VVDKLTCDDPKTKIKPYWKRHSQAVPFDFFDDNFSSNCILASRNIEGVFMIESHSLNAFEVLRQRNIIVGDDAMNGIVARRADNKE
jgi:ribosomal protein L4